MNLEDFIKTNARNFDCDEDCKLTENHSERFLIKLQNRFKKLISIVPYLIRVLIVTILVFAGSIIVWNQYIRKDRHEITLKQKFSLFFDKLQK